jgi:hypothetical protein
MKKKKTSAGSLVLWEGFLEHVRTPPEIYELGEFSSIIHAVS